MPRRASAAFHSSEAWSRPIASTISVKSRAGLAPGTGVQDRNSSAVTETTASATESGPSTTTHRTSLSTGSPGR